ncbi:MAG: hypothetical protein ACFFDI_01055 [Promethearchaeota archaeon]
MEKENLIEEIKNDIVNEKVSLATALRKAKLLAFELKSDDFRKWVDSELSGYESKIEIPNYRKIAAQNFGTFSGPFRSRIENMVIPTYNLPDSIKEFAEEIIFPEGVKELESLIQANKPLQRKWPAEAVLIAREHIAVSGGHVLVDVSQPITKQVLVGILDAVRNRLLDFLLGLQKAYPQITESRESLSEVPNEEVKKIFNFNVYGNHNILAAGDDFTQEVELKVIQNDIESLFRYLRKLNIPEEDLFDLNKSIKSDGERKNRQFGDKVKKWLGKMLVKATEGTWNIAIQTAATLITAALQKYYGW